MQIKKNTHPAEANSPCPRGAVQSGIQDLVFPSCSGCVLKCPCLRSLGGSSCSQGCCVWHEELPFPQWWWLWQHWQCPKPGSSREPQAATPLCSKRTRVCLFWQPHHIQQPRIDVLGNSGRFKRHWEPPFRALNFIPNNTAWTACCSDSGLLLTYMRGTSNKEKCGLQCEMLGRHHLLTGQTDVQIRYF